MNSSPDIRFPLLYESSTHWPDAAEDDAVFVVGIIKAGRIDEDDAEGVGLSN